MADRVTVEPWEGEDFVVCLDGRPLGRTLDLTWAGRTAAWLATAVGDLDEWRRPRATSVGLGRSVSLTWSTDTGRESGGGAGGGV